MRNLLLLLITFVGVTALSSGLMLLYEPDGSSLSLPVSVLDHSPFSSFFIPGLFLVILVSGACFYALIVFVNRYPQSYRVSLYAGLVVVGWIIGQMLLTQYFHWLQALYLGLGLLIVLLSYRLMGKAAF